MVPDYTFTGLIEFLNYAADHGLMKSGTATSYRTAASKIQDELTEQEDADVRQIDLDLVFQRFVNRNRVQVAPSTLAIYKRRLSTAIREFIRWRDDPTNYRSGINTKKGGTRTKDRNDGRPSPEHGKASAEPSPRPIPEGPSAPNLLTIPFPLRADFVASVQIPRDLKTFEAERLASFIKTLAIGQQE